MASIPPAGPLAPDDAGPFDVRAVPTEPFLPDPVAAAEDLPAWLPRVALAEACTSEVLTVAAASTGEGLSAKKAAGLLAAMDAAGLLLEPVDDSGAPTLRPEARTDMLATLERTQPGVEGVRRELLAAALAHPAGRLGHQLALWALEAGDWDSLALVWQTHTSSELTRDAATRAGFAAVAPEVRARLPQLSFAAAMANAYEPDADRLNFDRMSGGLIRDGLSLHADWARKDTAEAQVVAGAIRMLALASMPESFQADEVERMSAAYDELSRVILNASITGGVVSAKALTFFHSTAALVAIQRGDWSRARREGEFAMILGELCSVPGFVAAFVVASSSAVSGDTHHSPVAQRFLAGHEAHDCRDLHWLDPLFDLVKAEAAIRQLDRQKAEHHLQLHAAGGTAHRWFNIRAIDATVLRTAAILWEDPQRVLALCDSIIDDLGGEQGNRNAWGPLMLRCRAELLITLGEMNRAERVIEHLLARGDDSVSAVPAAWFYLATGDVARALEKAGAGILELKISLADRAFLYAVKGAALHLAGAPEELVASAAAAACEVCERGDTLVPFAALPAPVRGYLLSHHARHHGATACFVGRAIRRGAFEGLRDSGVATTAPIRLTPREKILLPLLATSATVQEIATQQYVSVNTVRKQVVALRQKVGASSRADLIRRANQLGLLNSAEPQRAAGRE